ncbi:MAG: hypothetical protein U0414_21670 [Polyangiaceae bacterium]
MRSAPRDSRSGPRAAAATVAIVACTIPAHAALGEGIELEPIARLGLGFSLHAEGGRVVPSFNLEVTAGIYSRTYSRGRQEDPAFLVGPEIGYALDSLGIHALDVTCGFGGGAFPFEVTYQPHLLVGTWSGDFAVGMRNGARFHVYYDFGTVELGHTFWLRRDALHHSFTTMFGFNPPALAQLFSTYL